MEEKGKENNPLTLVVIAALNEEEGIGPTLGEINDFLEVPLYLVVDGQSTDGTAKIAESMGAQVIPQKGSGKGDAIATAIEHARLVNVKYAVLIDADFTYPAEYLQKMIKILEENPKIGMVCGNRMNNRFHPSSVESVFYFGNRLLAFAHNLLNGVQMHDPLTGMRVVRWKILKDWRPRSRNFDVEVELNYYVERRGYGILEIPIHYRSRLGEKKLKLRHGLTILTRILTETMSYS
jgi:dolichol-phosphate mannosyltransferase